MAVKLKLVKNDRLYFNICLYVYFLDIFVKPNNVTYYILVYQIKLVRKFQFIVITMLNFEPKLKPDYLF